MTIMTEEDRIKISRALTGKPKFAEHCANIAKARVAMYQRMKNDLKALIDIINSLSENHQELEKEVTFIRGKLGRLFPKWTRELSQ